MSEAMTQFNAMEGALKSMKPTDKEFDTKLNDMSAYENKPQGFVPPDDLQLNLVNDENYNFNAEPKENFGEIPQLDDSQFRGYQERQRPEMPLASDDQVLFPGGPMISEVESWKKQHPDVWIVDDLPDRQVYIYRDLTRYEYKAIMATPNTDPLMREEMICEQCVLFPYDYSYGVMSNGKAGVVTIVAQHIMETSGFTRASVPKRL